MADTRINETAEEGMRPVRPRLELGMGLRGDEEGVGRNLDHLDDPPIGRESDRSETLIEKGVAIIVVDLVTMAMPFVYLLGAVELVGLGIRLKDARIGAQTHRPAEIFDGVLLRHQMDDRVHRGRIEFRGIGIFEPQNVAGEFDDRGLKAKTDAEERKGMRSGVADSFDHAGYASIPEATRDNKAIDGRKKGIDRLGRDILRLDPLDVNFVSAMESGSLQGFVDRDIGIVKRGIFADEGDFDFFLGRLDAIDHALPSGKVRLGHRQMERFPDGLGEVFVLEHERKLIDCLDVEIGKDVIGGNVTEERDLVHDALGDGVFGAADDDVRLKSHGLKRLDGHLRRLRLQLLAGLEIRDERDHDDAAVIDADFIAELPDGFKERLGFNIADRSSDFNDGDFRLIGLVIPMEFAFDRVGDVRDDLDSASAIIAMSFLGENFLVDLACRDIGVLVKVLIDETFIMSQIKVRFRPIVRDEDFTMLDWRHGSRIDVEIRIELLHGDLVSSRLEKTAEGCRGDAFAQSGNDAARNENILLHLRFLLFSIAIEIILQDLLTGDDADENPLVIDDRDKILTHRQGIKVFHLRDGMDRTNVSLDRDIQNRDIFRGLEIQSVMVLQIPKDVSLGDRFQILSLPVEQRNGRIVVEAQFLHCLTESEIILNVGDLALRQQKEKYIHTGKYDRPKDPLQSTGQAKFGRFPCPFLLGTDILFPQSFSRLRLFLQRFVIFQRKTAMKPN